MRKSVLVLLGAAAAVGLAASPVAAQPKKAKKLKAEFVTMYDDCPVTDGTTTGPPLSLDACGVTTTDPLCGFDVGVGSGKFQATVAPTPDIKFKAKLKGLTGGCEGEALSLRVRMKITTSNCIGVGRCTAEVLDLTVGSCTVTDGKCAIATTANTLTPGAFTTGDAVEMHITRVFLRRTSGVGAPADSFEAGLFVP